MLAVATTGRDDDDDDDALVVYKYMKCIKKSKTINLFISPCVSTVLLYFLLFIIILFDVMADMAIAGWHHQSRTVLLPTVLPNS